MAASGICRQRPALGVSGARRRPAADGGGRLQASGRCWQRRAARGHVRGVCRTTAGDERRQLPACHTGEGEGDPLRRPGVGHLGRPGVPGGGRPPSPPLTNRDSRRAPMQQVGRCRGLGNSAGAKAAAACGGPCTAASSRRHRPHQEASAAGADAKGVP